MMNRKRNRLKDFDYSSNNAYFITVCLHNRLKLFGEIVNEKMILSDSGKMIERFWLVLQNKFPHVLLDEYVIMPDHIHGIIMVFNDNYVGDDLCVVPKEKVSKHMGLKDKHTGLSLQKIIQWFKTMTTNEYIKGVKKNLFVPFNKKLWQRSYYDRIIRSEEELNKIREYIYFNPVKYGFERIDIENLNIP